MKNTTSISLIITTYNRPDALELVLLSVLNQIVLPEQVIIGDDGSSSETADLIKRYQAIFPVPLIHSWIEDKGFRASKSRNEAIKKSTCDFVIFIDGDILLHKDFIYAYKKYIKPGYFMMGSRALISSEYAKILIQERNIHLNRWHKGVRNKLSTLYLPFISMFIQGRQSPLKGVRSANMGVWRADLLLVDGFDERFTGWGREDSDIVARLMHAGIKRRNFKGAAICYHLGHPSNDKSKLNTNDKLLQDVLEQKTIKAVMGLTQKNSAHKK